ncbi:MAG: lipid IV(A) 3-deoxy-D-manno-octulosonic acid transferase [Pseudomonadota bacterium]
MRRLYTLVLYLLAPLVLLRLAWRGLRAPAYWRRWSERFGAIQPAIGAKVIWVHAVSVGEVQAAAPMVRALLATHEDYSLLLTTATPTGSAQVQALFGDEVVELYVPFDLPGAVAGFLDRTRPQLAIVMETELWPNLFNACRKRQIPLLLVNARLSARSTAGYRHFPRLMGKTLAAVTAIAAQSPRDARRFVSLGVSPERITVTGNLKYEHVIAPELEQAARELRHAWGDARPVWIAGSTHEGEDELLLDVFRQVRRKVPACLLVLVPRHPERFAAVADLCRQRGYQTLLRSERQPCNPDTSVFVGDTMGELQLFYMAANVAFVGGSLVYKGGHNLLEPAAAGIPVVTGPQVSNFTEICDLLVKARACRKVESVAELEATVTHWLLDADDRVRAGNKGRETVARNRGALGSVLQMIERNL